MPLSVRVEAGRPYSAAVARNVSSQMRAAGYYRWFKNRGLLAGRGHVGDLVWWKKNGTIKHIGIYIGGGYAVSALVNPWGVRKHTVRGIHMRLAAYGHVRLER